MPIGRAVAQSKRNPPTLVADKAYQPVNAPFGGSQGLRPASQPAPNAATIGTPAPAPTPVPAPEVPVTRPKGPTPKPKPAPSSPASLNTPREARGASGRQGLIIGLGVGLIIVNAVFGDNSGSLLKNVWKKPIDQQPQAGAGGFFPVLGEVVFLVILVIISRFGEDAERLVLTFLVGLWLLWAMFKLPAAYKMGWSGVVGQIFSGIPQLPPGGGPGNIIPATNTAPPALNPNPLGTKQAEGGSFVGTRVPHHSYIMG